MVRGRGLPPVPGWAQRPRGRVDGRRAASRAPHPLPFEPCSAINCRVRRGECNTMKRITIETAGAARALLLAACLLPAPMAFAATQVGSAAVRENAVQYG